MGHRDQDGAHRPGRRRARRVRGWTRRREGDHRRARRAERGGAGRRHAHTAPLGVGSVTVLVDGKPVRRVPLVTAGDVPGAGTLRVLTSVVGVPLTLFAGLAILLAAVLVALRIRLRLRLV